MKQVHSLKSILFFSIFLIATESNAEVTFKSIADLYLRSFSVDSEADASEISLKNLATSSKESSVAAIRPPKLTNRVARELVFNTILEKTYLTKDYLASRSKVLNKYLYGDLRIFYGTTTDPSYSLFNKIKRTKTIVGECILATMLATPTRDEGEIKNKQKIIIGFLDSKNEFDKLNKILSRYAQVENSLLSFYTANDPLYSKQWLEFMHSHYYYGVGSDSNKDALSLELKKRLKMDFWNIFYEFTYPIYWRSLLLLMVNMTLNSKSYGIILELINSSFSESMPLSALGYRYKTAEFMVVKIINGNGISPFSNLSFSLLFLLNSVTYELPYFYFFHRAVKFCSEHTSVLSNLALRMRDLKIFFQTLIDLDDAVSKSKELNKVYGAKLKNIRALLARKDDDTELGNLIKYILEMPLDRKWQYFLNNSGKLLASYSLFVEHKNKILDAMAEVGELDAIFSIVKLYEESQQYSPNNCYTFVKLLPHDENTTPSLKIEGMWHPLIDAKIAVTNDISMNENLRTIILTGPNAGGKSTYLTNIAICVLMGQAFGIAPAKNIDFTTFSKISSYIDVSDDIIEGNSLFKAEVRRAQEHIQMLVGLKSHEFTLTLFDEPFSGTNPIEGAAAEYSILFSLSRFRASFTIVATHFPLVMLLEDNNPGKAFANYKVFISEDSNKLHYSYKVLKGKSNQAIAIRILEEEGFDTTLLKRAKEIISNPAKYIANFK